MPKTYEVKIPFNNETGFVRALRNIGYRVKKVGITHYIKKMEGRRSVIYTGPHMRNNSKNDLLLEFLTSYPPERWAWESKVSGTKEAVEGLVSKARTLEDTKDFIEHLSRAIVFSHDSHLRSTMTDLVLPAFFERYPGGTVIPLAVDFRIFTWTSLVSNLALAEKYGNSMRVRMNPDRGIGALRESHPDALPRVRSLLSLGLNLFYPYVYGFVVECRRGLLFTFLFDQAFEIEPKFPWDMFDIIRQTSLLEERTTDTVQDMLTGQATSKTAHKRMVYPKLTLGEVENWFEYWANRLDNLIQDTLDLTNFVMEGQVKHIEQFQYLYSLDRVFSNTLLINSERNPMIRKTLAMQVLDILANIMSSGPRQEGESFKYFLSNDTYEQHIQPLIQILPLPVREHLDNAAEAIYADIREVATAGLWLPFRAISGKIIVGQSSRGSDELSEDEYTATLLRAIRNSHHGYKIRDFESLLLPHTGNTSDYLADLPAILSTSIMISPSSFRRDRWGLS